MGTVVSLQKAGARERALGTLEERELFTLYRRRNGIRQTWVAAYVGISQPTLSSYEQGHRRFSASRIEELWAAVESLAASGKGSGAGAEGSTLESVA